jgi:hypothetical protein
MEGYLSEGRGSLCCAFAIAALGASFLWCPDGKADSSFPRVCDPTSANYNVVQCDKTYGLNRLPAVCNPQNALFDRSQCYLNYGPDDGRGAPGY